MYCICTYIYAYDLTVDSITELIFNVLFNKMMTKTFKGKILLKPKKNFKDNVMCGSNE